MDNKKQKPKEAFYDMPIERPFEELPEWFVRTLNSRLVTKRPQRDSDKGSSYTDAGSRNGGSRSERASGTR